MKLAVFTTTESFVEWHKREIEAIRNHGLKQAKERYENALKGDGKKEWMNFNKTTDETVWQQHLEWLKGEVDYLERKIKKYERKIAKHI